jgi:hypothetical protein
MPACQIAMKIGGSQERMRQAAVLARSARDEAIQAFFQGWIASLRSQ